MDRVLLIKSLRFLSAKAAAIASQPELDMDAVASLRREVAQLASQAVHFEGIEPTVSESVRGLSIAVSDHDQREMREVAWGPLIQMIPFLGSRYLTIRGAREERIRNEVVRCHEKVEHIMFAMEML